MLFSDSAGRADWTCAIGQCLIVCASVVAASVNAAPLTLDQAWRRAETANPALQTAKANQAAAQGQLADARSLLWNNPQLSGQGVRRDVPLAGLNTQRWHEWSTGISQTFEIAGQQDYRREAATQQLAALQATLQETLRQVRAAVEQRFVQVLALQLRIGTEEEALNLVEEAAATVKKRVTAGEDSRLDGNLAAVEAERARNQLNMLREQLTEARAELGSVLQLAPESLPEVEGELTPAAATYSLDQLLDSAAQRPQLRSLESREAAAKNRLNLERALVYPDVTVGLSVGHEGPFDAREKLTTLSVSLPLPLFRRNATGIGQASTELTVAQIEREVAGRDKLAQVRALWLKVESLRARVKRLEDTVLASLDENQRLSAKSYRVGEIGLLQLIVVNRQVLDGRRDLLDARTELRLATVALEAAAGWPGDGD
jgi:cobalt-zinc-cadmium efflux system outer membrane protein